MRNNKKLDCCQNRTTTFTVMQLVYRNKNISSLGHFTNELGKKGRKKTLWLHKIKSILSSVVSACSSLVYQLAETWTRPLTGQFSRLRHLLTRDAIIGLPPGMVIFLLLKIAGIIPSWVCRLMSHACKAWAKRPLLHIRLLPGRFSSKNLIKP